MGVEAGYETDLAVVEEQERLLRFPVFSAETAWEIGFLLRCAAAAREAAMTFEIRLAGRVLFAAVTGDAPMAQADWIRRKRNTVMRFGRSSYAMGLELATSGKALEQRHEGLTLAKYAMHGGGFPIRIGDSGCVGTIVSSGLAQREDHTMVVDAMAEVMGVDVPRWGSPPRSARAIPRRYPELREVGAEVAKCSRGARIAHPLR